MGGYPSKNTPKDKRLKRNNPKASKPPVRPVQPSPKQKKG